MGASGKVVVIGAGVMGAWSALWLRRRGLDVTLIDQYEPGSNLATSGDETRVTRSAHGPDDLYPRWQRHALAQWKRLEEEAHVRLFLQCGTLWLAHRDDGFEGESIATLARLGIPFEKLDHAALAQRWPQVESSDIPWAFYEPEGGALMAKRGVMAATDVFVRDGGRLERAVVQPPSGTDGAGGRLGSLRLADGHSLEADAYVFAAGPWLGRLLPDVLDGQIDVTRQELVYFATPPGDDRFDAEVMPTWVDYDGAFYGIASIEGRGFKVAPDWPGPVVDPDHEERRLSDERVEAARGLLRTRFPALAGQPVSEGRICQYETTPDTHFIIGPHPAWSNTWVVGGGSGHGYKHGPTIGEYVSALVTGDESTLESLGPSDNRFALGHRQPGQGMRTSGAPPSDEA